MGKQRWFCKRCNKFFIWQNKVTKKNQQLKLFRKWVIGRRTLKELSQENKKSIDTLRKLFRRFLNHPPTFTTQPNKNCHLIIDGVYFKNNFCLIEYFDNDLKYPQHLNLVLREKYEIFLNDLTYLEQSGLNIVSITSDGHKGLIKAINGVFPCVVHQRCLIHIQRMGLIYLTRFPKTQAGVELRKLVRRLRKIDNKRKAGQWVYLFRKWCEKHHQFLQEKSQAPSGKRWYTHKLLRRTRSLIKNALPNLFHCLDDPQIPKSTNGLEAGFSYLKNELKIHRGLSEENRKNFILWYHYFKQKKD